MFFARIKKKSFNFVLSVFEKKKNQNKKLNKTNNK